MNTKRKGPAATPVRAALDRRRQRPGPPVWTTTGLVCLIAMGTLMSAGISRPQDANTADSVAADSTARSVHEITWMHASPAAVRNFILFVSSAPGLWTDARQIDVGKPSGSSTGSAQLFSALVPVAAGEYVAVAAIGLNGLRSGLSAWSQPHPSRPGQPLVVEP